MGCIFNAPKAPPPDPAVEAERQARLTQIEEQKDSQSAERAQDKKRRTQEMASRSAGMVGMRSLISGSRGGAGFGRELLG